MLALLTIRGNTSSVASCRRDDVPAGPNRRDYMECALRVRNSVNLRHRNATGGTQWWPGVNVDGSRAVAHAGAPSTELCLPVALTRAVFTIGREESGAGEGEQ